MSTGRPGRPLGLSLAIVISVMLFSVLPLAQIIVYLLLQRHFQNIEFVDGGGAVGSRLSDLPGDMLIVQFAAGLLFFIVGVMAWRGKPASMRFVLAAAVLSLAAVTTILTLISLNRSQTLETGLDSSAALADSLLQARLVVTALVALYVIWYVNRGPARAFYRGYYLLDPDQVEQKSQSAAGRLPHP